MTFNMIVHVLLFSCKVMLSVHSLFFALRSIIVFCAQNYFQKIFTKQGLAHAIYRAGLYGNKTEMWQPILSYQCPECALIQ